MGRGGVIALKAPRKMQPIAPKRCPISTVVVLPAPHNMYKGVHKTQRTKYEAKHFIRGDR
jgi:hypothetical protein